MAMSDFPLAASTPLKSTSNRVQAGVFVLFLTAFFPALSQTAGEVVFIRGEARIASVSPKSLALGNSIDEGDTVRTGPEGHVHIRLIDKGVLIIRPGSEVKISEYRQVMLPATDRRMRIDLQEGVVRNVTGEWSKEQPKNYRMNTPLAAIGVRGTDFTVFTDSSNTLASINSGAIRVAPLGGSCEKNALGPCDSESAVLLRADHEKTLVAQVTKGAQIAKLLDSSINGVSPDSIRPPSAEEKESSSPKQRAPTSGVLLKNEEELYLKLSLQSRKVIWGRWTEVFDPNSQSKFSALEFIAGNPRFALFRDKNDLVQIPNEGTASFGLRDYDAFLETNNKQQFAALIQDARLTMDFAQKTFETSFQLSGGGQTAALQAKGGMLPNGKFFSNPISSNMSVTGALGASTLDQAGYIFRGRLDNQLTATGATFWTR